MRKEPWLLPTILTCALLTSLNAVTPLAANWAAIFLFLLGVPHGAVERTRRDIQFRMPTLAYTALYLVFGVLVFASWLISPLGTFVLFLILSAIHFGLSEPDVKLIGAWVVIGSCLFYPIETLSIFSTLMNVEVVSQLTVEASKLLAIFAAIAVGIEVLWRCINGRKVGFARPFFLIAIFLVLPPIHAVAVYFFAFHGLGEFAKTIRAVSKDRSETRLSDVVLLYGPATFPAMIGAIVMIFWVVQGIVPIEFATGLGVAFIIPHMLPVEALLSVDRGEL